ncbi:hypothetical protein ACHAXR_004857 [Thalassiosira sp. AJA248-18]
MPVGSFDGDEARMQQTQIEAKKIIRSPLSLTLRELSGGLEGSGRAAVVWDCLKAGIDPNSYYSSKDETDASDKAIADAWLAATGHPTPSHDISSVCLDENILGRRQGQGLGAAAWKKLQNVMREYHRSNNGNDAQNIYTIENSIASLSHMKVSSDGTTKLLSKMRKDGLEVESVIIPWMDKGFSTLCVSSQVGCRQGCTFCATGRMGKLRSLTTDEILVQVYYASKVCRVVSNILNAQNDDDASQILDNANVLPKVDNIVFMGMGEPADNIDQVVPAVNTMVDRRMFGLAQSKVTISTVAPDPTVFAELGKAPAVLAWSVHAVDDMLRHSLVPTTKHSMEELKNGLVQALSCRSNKLRRTMLEVALIEDVNDSDEAARLLAAFSQSIMDEVPGSKVVVNLIPFNAIDHPTYRTPSMERVLGFQKIVTDGGVLCYVRTTRGDEDSAACGQLATKKKRAVS